MSDSNGHAAPTPPPEMRGGVNLTSHLLLTRVREIASATIKKPLPHAPVLREDVIVNHKSPIDEVNIDFVIEHVNAKRWQIMAKLGILGLDVTEGEWSLVDIGHGEDAQGRPVCQLALTWSVPEKSTLAIVE